MEISNTSARRGKAFNAPVQLLEGKIHAAGEEALEAEATLDDRDAILLTSALQEAQQAPDVRRAKVAALKAQVDAGAYKMDERALAESILREEAALFSF